MRAQLFHSDRQTDVTKLIFNFRNLAEVSKKMAACRDDVRPSVTHRQRRNRFSYFHEIQ